jgi:hypothetical protein
MRYPPICALVPSAGWAATAHPNGRSGRAAGRRCPAARVARGIVMPARSRPHSDPAGLGPGLSFLQVAESKVPKPACSTTSPSWPQAKCAPSSTTPARCSPPNAATPTSSPCTTSAPPVHPPHHSRRRRRRPGPGLARRTPAPDLPRAQRLRRTPGRRRTGRAAGLACAASRAADVVDTIVITTAVRHQAPVVTGDPGDLTRIADCIGVKIRIFAT